jgi:hypothetical protein
MTNDVMGYSINTGSQKEYDKTPEDNEVHHPGKGVAKKAPVGQNIHNSRADENRYSLPYVLRAVIRLAKLP